MTTAAERAYASAVQAIRRTANRNEDSLDLSGEAFHDLEQIPQEIESLRRLRVLKLDQTSIKDLSPLKLTLELEALYLLETKISDLSPISSHTYLEHLALSYSQVADLRPIKGLDGLGKKGHPGLTFRAIPALQVDSNLQRLSEEEDSRIRSSKTLAYLRTLPAWPKPYNPSAGPDGKLQEPIGPMEATSQPVPALLTPETHIAALLRHAIVTRVTAAQLADQIATALRGLPASEGNQLPPVLQLMSEVGEVLDMMARAQSSAAEEERNLRLRISQLEVLVERLTDQLSDANEATKAAEALAKKDGFLASYRKSLGTAAAVGTVGIIAVGVPTAAIYFLGVEHPLVQAYLTAIGRLPK